MKQLLDSHLGSKSGFRGAIHSLKVKHKAEGCARSQCLWHKNCFLLWDI